MYVLGVIVSTLGGTAVLLVLLAWIFREWITTRLRQSVKHEFDTKFEAIKHDYRQNIERLTADLRERSTTIDSLQAEVFGAMAARRNLVEARRLAAIDCIWSTLVGPLRSQSSPALNLTFINYDASAAAVEKNSNAQAMFKSMLPTLDPSVNLLAKAAEGQPYVTSEAWAMFNAYHAIVMFGVLRMKMLADGINSPQLVNANAVKTAIRAALPHVAAYIQDNDPSVFGYLLSDIESQLLVEFKRAVEGHEISEAAFRSATAVVKASYEFAYNEAKAEAAADGVDILVTPMPPERPPPTPKPQAA